MHHSGCLPRLPLPAIIRSPDPLGGEPVFAGTRVPVKGLFDHLAAGESIADFLDGFPSVRREQVIAVLAGNAANP